MEQNITFLHTRIRVSNLQQSADWYEGLGFKLTRKIPISPQGNQIWFLELGPVALEITYSPEYKVSVPEDLMHIAIGVNNIYSYCEQLQHNGYEIWPKDWKESFSQRKMAFVTDPDGYEVEILERK